MKLKQITVSLMALGLSSLALAVEPFTIKDIRVEGLQRTAPTTVFSPLSLRIQEMGLRFGIAAMLMLMLVAFFNDITRLFG